MTSFNVRNFVLMIEIFGGMHLYISKKKATVKVYANAFSLLFSQRKQFNKVVDSQINMLETFMTLSKSQKIFIS